MEGALRVLKVKVVEKMPQLWKVESRGRWSCDEFCFDCYVEQNDAGDAEMGEGGHSELEVHDGVVEEVRWQTVLHPACLCGKLEVDVGWEMV